MQVRAAYRGGASSRLDLIDGARFNTEMPRNRLTFLAAALALVAVIAVSFWLGRRSLVPLLNTGHINARHGMLWQQAEDAAPGGVLLVGDSITEMTSVPVLCGRPVLNAGIGATTVADWQGKVAPLVARARPGLVVIALGTNDASRSRPFEANGWRDAIRGLVAEADGVPVWLVEPPLVDAGRSNGDILGERLAAQRTALRGLAGVRVISAVSFAGHTPDGIHPDRVARERWRQALAAACS